ncbi:MAG: hypothetical protein KJ044_12705 [Planctomycetes bacterium]|nr:hypothetical protein [Planctomycetota bacterium]
MRRIMPALLALAVIGGCQTGSLPRTTVPDLGPADVGAVEGIKVTVVARNLSNPTHVSFRPGDGALTVCDSANGRVLLIDGKTTVLHQGMQTEYWKKISPTENYYKIGPLFCLWLNESDHVVGDGGGPDGQETLIFHVGKNAFATNAQSPTQPENKSDLGEGNFVGPVLSPDGKTIYAASHGNDARSWIVRVDVKTRKLEHFISSDEAGVEVNAPMQCLIVRDRLLVLYSGAGGKDDSRVVEYDLKAKRPVDQWALPGLVDAMGIAPIPGRPDEYAVVDNNWDLTSVKKGKLARVKLAPGRDAGIKILADNLRGPVHCAFGPDGRLYVACLGTMFDESNGEVIAISGIR